VPTQTVSCASSSDKPAFSNVGRTPCVACTLHMVEIGRTAEALAKQDEDRAMAKAPEFEAADYLDSREAIAGYLSEAFAAGDNEIVTRALDAVARAKGKANIARETGLNRENLYRSLGEGGRPEFGTVMKVLNSLDMELVVRPKGTA
jgi:probable addiction module antidote protein